MVAAAAAVAPWQASSTTRPLAYPGASPYADGVSKREELELAKRASEALAALLGPAVEALHLRTVDPPGHPRRLRRRLTWLLLGPGPLAHELPD